MKPNKRIPPLFSCLLYVGALTSAAASKKLPNIEILATGGTIAGAAASETQAAYTSGAVTIDAMLAAVPGIKGLANVKGEQISNVGSQDMTLDIMLMLAKRIKALLAQNDVDGIVVDPRSRGRGVLVVMNDWIHGAHSLTKPSTTAIQTFMSPLRGLVGVSSYGKNDFYNTPGWKHTTASEFDIGNVTKLPRVDILFACADMSPDLIDAAVANGAKGIVIAGVGNGNMNRASLEAAARNAKKGVVVVRSTRLVTGTVGRNVEVNDDDMNLIASDELNPQKSRILLMLALLKPRSNADIQNLFYTY